MHLFQPIAQGLVNDPTIVLVLSRHTKTTCTPLVTDLLASGRSHTVASRLPNRQPRGNTASVRHCFNQNIELQDAIGAASLVETWCAVAEREDPRRHGGAAVFYDKQKSFLDNITCEANAQKEGHNGRKVHVSFEFTCI